MGKRFSANGDYVDFASLELGISGLTRLPNELSAVNFGDSISRADIEGTGQVPLGQARGRYKCDNFQIKCTLEAAKEIYDKLAAEAEGRGAGNVIISATLTIIRTAGEEPIVYEFPEISLMTVKEAFAQQDASLNSTLDFKCRYMLRDGNCLGDIQ